MASRSVQTLGSQPAGSSQARAPLRASLGEGWQQDVLTWNGGQRFRQGAVKVERAEPGKGGLTKVTVKEY